MPRTDLKLNFDIKQRNRNVAHLWADKRVMRLLRKELSLDEIEYKNYRAVYLALCEIDSDFSENNKENSRLHSITKTCATYAGLSEDVVRFYLDQLRKIGLIDYGQDHSEDGKFSTSFLQLWVFDEMKKYARPTPRECSREKPFTGKAGNGKTRPIENNTNINISIKKSIESKDSAENARAVLTDKKSSVGQAAKLRSSAKRKTPDPAIARVVDYFAQAYQREYGHRYPISRSRDYPAAKLALSAMREDEIKSCIDFFLTSAEMKWTRETVGKTLSLAVAQKTITKFHSSKPKSKQSEYDKLTITCRA